MQLFPISADNKSMVKIAASWLPHFMADLLQPQAAAVPSASKESPAISTEQSIFVQALPSSSPSLYQALFALLNEYEAQLKLLTRVEDNQILRSLGSHLGNFASLKPQEVTGYHVEQLQRLVDLANTYLECKKQAQQPANDLFGAIQQNYFREAWTWINQNSPAILGSGKQTADAWKLYESITSNLNNLPALQQGHAAMILFFSQALEKNCYGQYDALPNFENYQTANRLLKNAFAALSAEDTKKIEQIYRAVSPNSDSEQLQKAYQQALAQLDTADPQASALRKSSQLLMMAGDWTNLKHLLTFEAALQKESLKLYSAPQTEDESEKVAQLRLQALNKFAELGQNARSLIETAQVLRDAEQFARSNNPALQEQAQHMLARVAADFSVPMQDASVERLEQELIAPTERLAEQISALGNLALYFVSQKRSFLIGTFDWETEAQHQARVANASSVASYRKLATRLQELKLTVGNVSPEQLRQVIRVDDKKYALHLYPEALAEDLPPVHMARLRQAMLRDILEEFERHDLWQKLDRAQWQLDHTRLIATEKYQGSILEGKTVFNPDIYEQRKRQLKVFAALQANNVADAKRDTCIANPFQQVLQSQNDHEVYLARVKLAIEIPVLAAGGLVANVLKTACAGTVADLSAVLFAEGSNLARATAALGINGELMASRAALLGVEGAFFKSLSNSTAYYLDDHNPYNNNESHTYNVFATIGGWLSTAAMFGVVGKALNAAVTKAPPWLQEAILVPRAASTSERWLGKAYTVAVETAAFSAWTPVEETLEWSAAHVFASSESSKDVHIETDPWQILVGSFQSVIFFRLANTPMHPLHARIQERWQQHNSKTTAKLFDELHTLEEQMMDTIKKDGPSNFASPKEKATWLLAQTKKLEQTSTQLLKQLMRTEPGTTAKDFHELQARTDTWRMITQAEKAYQKDAQVFGKGNPFGIRKLAGNQQYSAASVETLMAALQANPRVGSLSYADGTGTIRFVYTQPLLPGTELPVQHEVTLTPYLAPQTAPSEALRQLFLKWRMPAGMIAKIMPRD